MGAADIPPEETQPNYYDTEEILDYAKLECLGLIDEDTYSAEPFASLAEKMEDVTPDGKIKKKIIREGYGETAKEGQEVSVHYNAYTEYIPEPFDSSYLRKKPLSFSLGDGKTLLGIDAAVRTMKTNEMAQFIVHYEYAYGKMGYV